MDCCGWEELTMAERVEITGPAGERYVEILSPKALELLVLLHDVLADRRAEALAARRRRQAQLSGGAMLDFRPETAHIRAETTWRVAAPAPGLVDRRVEITGPTMRKMTINALNSGANVWLADFEDANTPLWSNMIEGQLNLKDALGPDELLATIVVRPRGWHLDEKHVLVDGRRASGSLTDFALYMAGCAQRQLDKDKGPYFYLPKLESHVEARLWNDAFNIAQDYLGIPRGTIRATVLIETIPAAFEMDEILYELREHSAGLNAGRWDYLFSVIKKFRTRGKDFMLPERNAVTIRQWINNDVILDDGPLVTKDVVERMIDEELVKIRELAGDDFDAARYGQAVALFTEVALADSFAEFLTLPAYERMP
jgi:malate synthase